MQVYESDKVNKPVVLLSNKQAAELRKAGVAEGCLIRIDGREFYWFQHGNPKAPPRRQLPMNRAQRRHLVAIERHAVRKGGAR